MFLFSIVLLLVGMAAAEEEDARNKGITVTFTNRREEPIRLFWVNDNDQTEQYVTTVKPEAVETIHTFPTHRFVFYPLNNQDDVLGTFSAEHNAQNFEVKYWFASDRCRFEAAHAAFADVLEQSLPTEYEWTAISKRSKVHRRAERERLVNNERRLKMNREQPPSVPTFTKIGFDVRKVPAKLQAEIQKFWQAHKSRAVRESWDLGNAYINHWQVAPTMAYLTEEMKQKTFAALKPLLEEWIGGYEIEPTACYGIRVYHRGSELQNHVDRKETHAVSAIINVAQEVEEEWPLEVHNHTDHLHRVHIKPGDMVFYESASRIHGRPAPLNGAYYANFFVHFRPVDKWIHKPEFVDHWNKYHTID